MNFLGAVFRRVSKNNSPLWKRVIAWERSRAGSGYGIIWGDADQNKQEEIHTRLGSSAVLNIAFERE